MTTALRERERTGTSQAATMRAAVLVAPGETRIDTVPMPVPGPGQVRVRLSGCGVCASNLEPWAGPDWMRYPTAAGDLGHEGWGVVDALGPDVEGLAEGDPVATLFFNSYAEYDVGPATSVAPLPSALRDAPFPGEPLACAMNIFRRGDIEAGQTVAIVGAGFLGALLVRLASLKGARVIAISRRAWSLDLAARLGASHTIALDGGDDVAAAVGEITGGGLCERVIEATGKQRPLDLAGQLAGVRGRLVIAGYHQDGPRSVDMQQWNWRGLDVINAHERDPAIYMQGLREAIAAVESGRIELGPLLTHSYPLERLGEALDATRDRPDGFLKALVTMR